MSPGVWLRTWNSGRSALPSPSPVSHPLVTDVQPVWFIPGSYLPPRVLDTFSVSWLTHLPVLLMPLVLRDKGEHFRGSADSFDSYQLDSSWLSGFSLVTAGPGWDRVGNQDSSGPAADATGYSAPLHKNHLLMVTMGTVE